jgi:TPR repeat protein
MGVNNKEGMMKTSKIKTVRNIGRIRTLLVTLSVGVCIATLMGCGNASEKDASPAADASPADDIETLRKAAEAGDAAAQFKLGVMYDNGNGVAEDFAEALKWYRKAAEQGHAVAQNNLGEMYYNGKGVPEDNAEAFKWFRKAAEQRHAFAQFALGLGGVPQDDVAAYAWYSVAAASGHDKGRENRDWMMDRHWNAPSQLKKGQVMAREIFERIEKRKAAERQ